MATVQKIEDFGEKIGGARKDLAEFRKNGGFTAEQVSSWTDAEREKFIIKKELFPAPDYRKMVDEQGYSREAAFFIKKVLDALPTKPYLGYTVRYANTEEEKREAIIRTQDTYIATINIIKDALMDVKTLSDATHFKENVDKTLRDNDIALMRSFERNAVTKFSRASNLSSGWGVARLLTELDKKAFLYSDEEEKLRHFTIEKYDGNNVINDEASGYNRLAIRNSVGTYYYYQNEPRLMDMDNWKPDTYFVRLSDKHNHSILEINFITKEEAQSFAIAHIDKERAIQAEQHSSEENTRKTRLVPPQLEHIHRTGEDYRENKDVTGNMMLETFGFKGGEFGNWENQNDRQTNLNMSYEAFKDLAKALDIADKDISLGGELSVAYGARGRGNALAHFEPLYNVINLTKLRGAGSLGHEFGHALDYAIANFTHSGKHFETEVRGGLVSDVMYAIKFKTNAETGNRQYTDFYNDAICLDRQHSKCDKGYWHSDVELFARAFATYLQDKLEPNKSDYLSGHAEFPPTMYRSRNSEQDRLIYTYPRGEERAQINAEFDKLIEKLKEMEMLHQRPQEKEHSIIEQQDGIKITPLVSEPQKPAPVNQQQYNLDDIFPENAEYVQMSLDDISPSEPSKPVITGLSEINAETAIGMIEYGAYEVYDKNNALVTNINDIVNEADIYKAHERDVKLFVECETIALAIDDISETYRFMPKIAGEPYYLDLMRYPDYYEWDSFKVGKNVYQNVMIALQEGNYGVLNEYLTEVCNSDRNSEYAKRASEVKDMLECYEVNRAFLDKCKTVTLDNREEGEYNRDKAFDPSQITSITKSKNEAEGYTVNGISGIPPEAASGKYIAYVDFGDGEKWFQNVGDSKRALNIDDTLDGDMKCVIIDNPIYHATEKQLDQLAEAAEPSKNHKPKTVERD